MKEVVLRPKPPYQIIKHLSMYSIPGKPIPGIYEGNCCRRVVSEIAYEACIEGEPDEPRIMVRVYKGDDYTALNLVKHIYNVNLDYNKFLNCVRRFPKLHKLALKYRGLRPALTPTLYEALIKSIISQNISQKLALRIVSNLVSRFGTKVEIEGKVFYDFPKPDTLASLNTQELKSTGLSLRKVEYIKGISKVISEGYDIESLKYLRPTDAVRELVKFKGVGVWTAKLSLMASTGNLSLDLLEDKAVRRGLKLLGISKSLDEIISRCREYVGLIMYLSALDFEVHSKR